MSKKMSRLDNIYIQKPCRIDWEQMIGNDQTRFCNECNKQVYNLSTMTRRQAEALVTASRGNLCVRLNRQSDGTTLTTDDFLTPSVKLHSLNKRPSPIASAVVSAIMAVSPVMAAQTSVHLTEPAAVIAENNHLKAQAKLQGGTSGLSGKITSFDKQRIAGATVMLINESTGEFVGSVTSETGEYQIDATGSGVYILRVEAEGFKADSVHGIKLNQQKPRSINLALEPNDYLILGGMGFRSEPLRDLYNKSDRVVVATVGKAVKAGVEGESKLMKIALQVSSTLKGEHKSSLYVYNYVYKDEQSDFVTDERLLVFLQRRESKTGIEDGYEVSGYKEGRKNLSDADLKIYLQRIEALQKMEEKEDADQTDLAEWLVRCVEDKATRSEGTYELAAAARELRYSREDKDSDEEEADSESEAQEAVSKVEATVTEDHEKNVSERVKLLALLTPQQKERLLTVLFSAEDLKEINYDLVELAKEWNDGRLLPFLLNHLRRVQADPPQEAQAVVWALSEYFDDEKLKEAAEQCIEILRHEEEEEEGADTSNAPASREQEQVNLKKKSNELLKKFLALVEDKVNKQPKTESKVKTDSEAEDKN